MSKCRGSVGESGLPDGAPPGRSSFIFTGYVVAWRVQLSKPSEAAAHMACLGPFLEARGSVFHGVT